MIDQTASAVVSPTPATANPAEREVDPQEKALVADWNKRIEAALKRVEKEFKQFEKNRKLMKGKDSNNEDQTVKMRTNLFFSNMAALLPQVYAKDPEFAVQITANVPTERQRLMRAFAATAEKVITQYVVKDANLKKQSKKVLRSAYTTAVGWFKVSWQENRRTDPLILNQIKDTQDNLNRLQDLRAQLDDPEEASKTDLIMAQLKQTLAGLETQQEVSVARGIALDRVMSEDILIIDPSVLEVSDYPRASAIGHRVWMTQSQFESYFGYKPQKAKTYTVTSNVKTVDGSEACGSLYMVWETWSQDDNRIYYICQGEEGFCKPPKSPDWTGRRWYPFFLLAFNEIDGSFYPLSDVELIQELVEEYNDNRADLVRDRKGTLPVNIVRKGSSLTDSDLERIKNRNGSDIIVVEGVGGQKITDDIFAGQLGNLNPVNYDTAPARADIEMMIGGGDAARGTVTKAKTATEAEILSQGLRGRSAERQDTMEDVFNEIGQYALEMLLRKLTEQEVKNIVGQDAVWPQMDIDGIFNLVSIEVRSGSTGKPDRLQDQDRWTKLLPVIQQAIEKVSQLRQQGQDQLANAVIELTRETLRRFDERIDIEQFLPPAPEGQDDPAMLKQQVIQLQQQLKDASDKLKEAVESVEKGYVQAAAQIATSANPMIAAQAFAQSLQAVQADQQILEPQQQPQAMPPQAAPQPTQTPPPAAPMAQPTQLQ